MFKKAIFVSLCILALAAGAATAQGVDAKKQTSIGKYATAVEVLKALRADPAGTVILDVRPVAAYYYLGHPAGAHNIPFLFWTGTWDDQKKIYTFTKNAKFAQAVAAKFPKTQKLYVLSKAGVRAAQAIEVLAAAGYTDLVSITDGFDAWSGLPDNMLTRKLDPELIYRKPQ